MSERPRVSFVVPVFNEPEAIGATLASIDSHSHVPHEVLVVYDFEEDTTLPVVRELLPASPTVRLVRNDIGRGVLNAMRRGMLEARGDHVIVSMADGSDDHRAVDAMVALADAGADVVAASRYMRGGRQIGGPRLKGLLSRMAGLSLHYFGGVGTHDATNNFKLYRRSFLDDITIESTGGFELALELTVKATLMGRGVAEVPAVWRDRAAGESNFKLRAWLPSYLHWYLALFRGRISKALGRRSSPSDTA